MAGYSGKPITAKLGVRPGHRVYVEARPGDLDDSATPWPPDVTVLRRLPRSPVDLVWVFCVERPRLERRFTTLVDATVVDGAVWVSWPKRSSGVPTDLDENVVRAIGLGAGVVDVKVAAVDDTWSALKFVRRLRDR